MKSIPHRSPLLRPWAVWLAVLIAVVGALAPTVSRALVLARDTAPVGVEICTSQGPRRVAADAVSLAKSSDPTRESVAKFDHCPFCLQTSDRVAPPPKLLPYLFSVQGGQQEVAVLQFFVYSATHPVVPPPRGPPGQISY